MVPLSIRLIGLSVPKYCRLEPWMNWPRGSLKRLLRQHVESALRFVHARAGGVETARDLAEVKPKRLPLRAQLYIAAMCLVACFFLVQTFKVWRPELSLRFVLYLAVALA